MRPPAPVPSTLLGRPFHRDEAIELGVSARQLEHRRFVELLPRVYRHTDTLMTPQAWVSAASLALPPDAHVSHQTRLVGLGLEYGSLMPMHFTIGRDLHLAVPNVFLHRTVRLPAATAAGVSVAASVVGFASIARQLDVIVVIDWLVHRGHLDIATLERIVVEDWWRPGTGTTGAALVHVEPRSRSLPESEVRVLLCCAGLPRPVSNDALHAGDTLLGYGDLVYRDLRLVIEYEGRQHALDTAQFQRDIHRYRSFRDADVAYLQITREMLRHPRTVVTAIHQAMVARGYVGPAPDFGPTWQRLLEVPDPLRHHARPRRSSRHAF